MPFGFELVVIVIMLAVNAVFAAYEMSLASISQARIAALINEKRSGARAAAFMKDHMEASLAVVQLGITFAAAIAAATGGAGIEQTLSPWLRSNFDLSEAWSEVISVTFLVIPLSAFTIVFAELIPKVFALDNKERVCLALSPAMKGLSVLAYPVVTIIEKIVKKVIGCGTGKMNQELAEKGLYELKAAANLARSSRLISAREEKIVLSAANLSTRSISSIMLPVSDISMIPVNSSLPDALIKAHLDLHTRFPVCDHEGDAQTIRGYVNFKDIVLALKINPQEPTIKGIMRPIKVVGLKTPISKVLEILIQEKTHIALVVSDDKIVEGLITMEDIIEELVGEIEDEFDRLPTYIHEYGTNWIMGGGVPVFIAASKMGLTGFKEDRQTLHDLCEQTLGRMPQGGDVIKTNGFCVIVRKLRRKKVAEAIVQRTGR